MQQELQSLIHDERRCVTIHHLAWQTTGGNRAAAAEELRALDQSSVQRFVVTPAKEERPDGVPCTVFKLSRSTSPSSNSFAVYAIRDAASTESLDAAHERDMAQVRDTMQGRGRVPTVQPPTLIRSAIEIKEEKMVPMDVDTAETSTDIQLHSKDALQLRSKPKKKTTAANFFNSRASTKKEEGKENQTTAAKVKAGKKPIDQKVVPPAKKKSKPAPTKPVAKPEKQDIGVVDDMIGDEESDEEEPTNIEKKNKTKPAPAPELMDLDSDDDEDGVVVKKTRKKKTAPSRAPGMVKTVGEEPTQQHRRRRLVKKKETYADDKGYIRMKVVEVWEDIPSDEEEAAKAKASKTKPKPAKSKAKNALKQGSLSGFFHKK